VTASTKSVAAHVEDFAPLAAGRAEVAPNDVEVALVEETAASATGAVSALARSALLCHQRCMRNPEKGTEKKEGG